MTNDIQDNVTEDELYRATNTPQPTAGCLIIGAALLSTAACAVVLIVAVL